VTCYIARWFTRTDCTVPEILAYYREGECGKAVFNKTLLCIIDIFNIIIIFMHCDVPG